MSKPVCGKKQKVRLVLDRAPAFDGGVNVFTYGSLMFDEVWQAVTGRLAASVIGRLDGYAAWRISGQTFPGLAPAPGHVTSGRIWLHVTSDELERLDRFESGIYTRELLRVEAADGRALECWVYEVRPESRALLEPVLWDREEFRRRHLAGFMKGA